MQGQARAWMHRDRMTRQSYFCAQLSLRRKMGSKRKVLVPLLQPNALWLGIADPFITRPLQCSPLNAADIGGTQNKGYKRGYFILVPLISLHFYGFSVLSTTTSFQPLLKMSFLQFLVRFIILRRPTFPGTLSLALQHKK